MDTDLQHKRALRDLLAGREVDKDIAHAALRWLRADVSVITTINGSVRLRVPILPRHASDLRGSRA